MQIPTVGTTRESNVSSIASFLRKTSVPVQIEVEEDSAATVNQLKKSLLKRLVKGSIRGSSESLASANMRAQTEGELLLVELEEAPVGPMGAAHALSG